MAISSNVRQLEKDKFVDDGTGSPAVNVVVAGSSSSAKIGTTVTHFDAVRFNSTTPVTSTGQNISPDDYQNLNVSVEIDSTLSPTSFRLQLEGSYDDVDYDLIVKDPVALLYWEATGTATAIRRSFTVKDFGYNYVRATGTPAGADATNYFDVTVKITPFKTT